MPVKCQDTTLHFSDNEMIHLYKWSDDFTTPARIVLLIHGLMMHGKSFDQFANHLASTGALVVAPDLKGFGRSWDEQKDKIDYKKSLEYLSALMRLLKSQYTNIPMICAGESLGAHLARKVASEYPDLVSGLILSSPCIRPRIVSLPLLPHTCTEIVLSGINPQRQFNLFPYAQQFLKVEEHNLKIYLEDPLTRKSLEVLELIDSIRLGEFMIAGPIPEEMPVLVIRGTKDCVCKKSSARKFLHGLSKRNMTVHTSRESGHIILQSQFVQDDIICAISQWLQAFLN